MIMADKIIRLRKKNGWSQEELAEKMDVSRQAVSKWEGAQSVPNLEKILQLSELFGVTTDYLLKDDIEDEEFTQDIDTQSVERVSLQNAHEFLELRKKASGRIAFATFLCILSPIALLTLGAASELSSLNISENLAGGIGLVVLILLVAIACSIYIYCGFQNSPYEFLENEPFETEYGVVGMVKEKQKAYRNTYIKHNIIGTCLCVLSPIALFVGAFTENEFFTAIMLNVMILIAGIGVMFFVNAGVKWASMQKLLKEGEFSEKAKQESKLKSTVAGVYWIIATAIFLGIGFIADDWSCARYFWPIVAVVFAAVMVLCNLFEKND